MSSSPLAGKTALVTGGAQRIGRAIALALADEGADVIIHYNTSADAAQDTCADIARRGVRAWALQADLQEGDAPERLARQGLEEAGSVHLLVNNASWFHRSRLGDLTPEDLALNMRLHAYAPLALSRALMAALPPGERGRVVNLLDAYLHTYQRSHVAYNLSKRALHTLTRMLALELAPDVTVNAVSPGVILPPPDEPPESVEPLVAKVPLQRPGEVSEIVAAVMFLLRADYVTGQVLYVDGGAALRAEGNV